MLRSLLSLALCSVGNGFLAELVCTALAQQDDDDAYRAVPPLHPA
jgi:hypothetical protein